MHLWRYKVPFIPISVWHSCAMSEVDNAIPECIHCVVDDPVSKSPPPQTYGNLCSTQFYQDFGIIKVKIVPLPSEIFVTEVVWFTRENIAEARNKVKDYWNDVWTLQRLKCPENVMRWSVTAPTGLWWYKVRKLEPQSKHDSHLYLVKTYSQNSNIFDV